MKSHFSTDDLLSKTTPHQGIISIIDELPPEDEATLQALNSREAGGLAVNLAKVVDPDGKTVGRVMDKFYVGYGHQSIGDCGTTSIFCDKISILAAKAIQDWELYSGQETSTRYVDVTGADYVDPIGTVESKQIIEKWFTFWREEIDAVHAHLMTVFPIEEGQNVSVYEKAIQARAFDVMRAFLPAACRTNASWHTNLRQAYDKLSTMKYHPCIEMQGLATTLLGALTEKYPNSFNHKQYEAQEAYWKLLGGEYSYFDEAPAQEFVFTNNINQDEYNRYRPLLLDNRPTKTEPAKFLKEIGTVRIDTFVDYGSYRDLQRHRNGVNRSPLLTTKYGFEQWYLDALPEATRARADALIAEQKTAIEALDANEFEKQYCTALGFRVPWRYTCGLPAAVYLAELRSNKTVHPTARNVALKLTAALKDAFPDLVLYADTDLDDWDIKRGTQDIVKK
jgi:thymidylate synthase ThyX